MHRVLVNKERPDFRVFVDLLYGIDANIDTDGDSNPVYSRSWTELHVRESENQPVTITLLSDSGSVFEVKSEFAYLEELAALYLFLYCGLRIYSGDEVLTEEAIDRLSRKYYRELSRAEKSVWHQSSVTNPYPNLV